MNKLAAMKNFIVLVLGILLLSSCRVYKDVEVKEVLDFKLHEIRSNGADCEIYLTILNPNHYKLTLSESTIQLTLENKPLGVLHLQEPIQIPKRSINTITLKCTAEFESLTALTGDLISLLFKTKYKLEGHGYVRGKALLISKKVPVDFSETLTKEDLGF